MAFFNTLCLTLYLQGDHSPDNVKFPDNALTGLRHFSAALLPMLSLTHIMPAGTSVTVSGTGRNATVHDLRPY